jgi:hypothetical protein
MPSSAPETGVHHTTTSRSITSGGRCIGEDDRLQDRKRRDGGYVLLWNVRSGERDLPTVQQSALITSGRQNDPHFAAPRCGAGEAVGWKRVLDAHSIG